MTQTHTSPSSRRRGDAGHSLRFQAISQNLQIISGEEILGDVQHPEDMTINASKQAQVIECAENYLSV